MNILSYNPGHDGAIAYLKDAHLLFSIEAEKNSNYRYSPISSHDVFNVLGELEDRGTEILSCGTCLDFFHLKERLVRGKD